MTMGIGLFQSCPVTPLFFCAWFFRACALAHPIPALPDDWGDLMRQLMSKFMRQGNEVRLAVFSSAQAFGRERSARRHQLDLFTMCFRPPKTEPMTEPIAPNRKQPQIAPTSGADLTFAPQLPRILHASVKS